MSVHESRSFLSIEYPFIFTILSSSVWLRNVSHMPKISITEPYSMILIWSSFGFKCLILTFTIWIPLWSNLKSVWILCWLVLVCKSVLTECDGCSDSLGVFGWHIAGLSVLWWYSFGVWTAALIVSELFGVVVEPIGSVKSLIDSELYDLWLMSQHEGKLHSLQSVVSRKNLLRDTYDSCSPDAMS